MNEHHQCDGTFSDVLDNDGHHLHPSVPAQMPAEFDEEKLRVAAAELASFLYAREKNKARFPSQELLKYLQALKSISDGAILFLSGGQPDSESNSFKLLAAFERALNWIWGEGAATQYQVLVRLAAYTWNFMPNVTTAESQMELLKFLGLKDKQQFNKYVTECAQKFGYRNRLMRNEKAIATFKKAAAKRKANNGKK
jgi:hypothetical protein